MSDFKRQNAERFLFSDAFKSAVFFIHRQTVEYMKFSRSGLIALFALIPCIAAAQPTIPLTPPAIIPPPLGSKPPMPPHPLMFNTNEVKFGSQGIGIQSCLYVTLTNVSQQPQVVKKLYVADAKDYNIPSPSQQMLPITIQPTSNLTLSVCFKPTKPGEHDSYLALVSGSDSIGFHIQGKGLKANELAKLPKSGMVIVGPTKKNKQWTFSVRVPNESHITMQVFNDLGMLEQTFLMNDLKPEGVYEQNFDGTDKGKKPLPAGTYYLRCVVDEVGKGNSQIFTKMFQLK